MSRQRYGRHPTLLVQFHWPERAGSGHVQDELRVTRVPLMAVSVPTSSLKVNFHVPPAQTTIGEGYQGADIVRSGPAITLAWLEDPIAPSGTI